MKEKLQELFSADHEKYYRVRLFAEKGFVRRRCVSCRKHFWTPDRGKDVCGDSSCAEYSFIGKKVTGRRLDYVGTWKEIERFFVRNGHTSVPRYPVICRWFPGLYFTIAGIVAFQRLDGKKTVFEVPANPVILPQLSIRFNDIPNVGVTGRHYTSFVMVQQTSIFGGKAGYWKDRCIELDYRLLTEVFRIRENEITFREDVWMGPNAFGPSLEYFAHGLELGNAVFTEFMGDAGSYTEMKEKVIDMGAGLERFAWLSSGTPSSYDAVFGPAIEYMKRKAGLKDSKLYLKYSLLAGSLDFEGAVSRSRTKEMIAKKLGITTEELDKTVNPLAAIYAIADHTKTLLFALADGAIPSNVGGGYNLRVILRRAMGFIEEFGFDFTLEKIASIHAKHLAPMYPELSKSLDAFGRIIEAEGARHKETLSNAFKIIAKLPPNPPPDSLVTLYQSHGITPEIIETESKKLSRAVEIPQDFYVRLTALRSMPAPRNDELDDIAASLQHLTPTQLAYYEDGERGEFTAKVIASRGEYIVLDRTLFYPTGGGQMHDTGEMENVKVIDVQKRNGLVFHRVADNVFFAGQVVRAKVDMEKRMDIMRHHTAIHVLNGSARKIIGEHIWQEGSSKTEIKASLDLTHYKAFTGEELEKIEALANSIIAKSLPVRRHIMPRPLAEQRYGLRIYQGGIVPSKQLRIIEIQGFDIEACGGTHTGDTKEIGKLVIIGSDRIKDGVNRIEIVAGKRADEFLQKKKEDAARILAAFKNLGFSIPKKLEKELADPREAFRQLKSAGDVLSVPSDQVWPTVERFANDITSAPKTSRKAKRVATLEQACEQLFLLWKTANKEAERMAEQLAGKESNSLLGKAKEGRVAEMIKGTRKDLIRTAGTLMQKDSGLTVILANESGDLVVMSKRENAAEILKKVCSMCGGAGGGRADFAQGKTDPAKFREMKGEF